MNNILVDSGFLYALYDYSDKDNVSATATARLYSSQFIIPYVTLTKAAYLFRRAGGVPSVSAFLNSLVRADYAYEVVLPDDLTRVREIMLQYQDARLDFVDCCIMALSERLNITQVCTFDRRDFGIFRPKHVDYLELLP